MEQTVQRLNTLISRSKQPSFAALVNDRFLIEIYRAIGRYAAFDGMETQSIISGKALATLVDALAAQLHFEMICDCSFMDNGEIHRKRLLVRCFCNLNDDFSSVTVKSIIDCPRNYRSMPCLPDDLAPVLRKRDLDRVASGMLSMIGAQTDNKTVPIDGQRIACSVGLQVMVCEFDPVDKEVYGKIFFEDATAIVKDSNTGFSTLIPVKRGTILVNSMVNGYYDPHVVNNTVMHEIVHWLLHGPAFQLAKVWNREYIATACRKQRSHDSRSWTVIDRMEWQANSLAPRLLMPDWITKFVADDWYVKYNGLSPILRMERTIDRLGQHFDVSRQMAKIRMAEIGYADAEKAFSYYEKRHHAISFEKSAQELEQNEDFRDALASGGYAYVDSCFVLRDKKYICQDEAGTLHLTQYAKAHMAECCLAFAIMRGNRGMQHGMLRYNVEDETFIVGSSLPADELAKRSQNVSSILQQLPNSFSETLSAHMDRKGVSCERLAEACLLSRNSIFRFKKEAYPSISLPNVICLCIGLKLHPLLSTDLIRKAGYTFNGSSEHTAYQMLLMTMTNSPIYECNDFLNQMGIHPLGNEKE